MLSDELRPRDLIELVQLAESLGYSELWLTDQRFWRDCYMGLTLAAQHSHRLMLSGAKVNYSVEILHLEGARLGERAGSECGNEAPFREPPGRDLSAMGIPGFTRSRVVAGTAYRCSHQRSGIRRRVFVGHCCFRNCSGRLARSGDTTARAAVAPRSPTYHDSTICL
jgi:hypothetical protein